MPGTKLPGRRRPRVLDGTRESLLYLGQIIWVNVLKAVPAHPLFRSIAEHPCHRGAFVADRPIPIEHHDKVERLFDQRAKMLRAPPQCLFRLLARREVTINTLKADRLPLAIADCTGADFHWHYPPIFPDVLALKNRGQPLSSQKTTGALLPHCHRGRGDKLAVVLPDEFLP